MRTMIYKNATDEIVSWVDRDSRIAEEINNIVESELGGVANDYSFVEAPDKGFDETWEIRPDGAGIKRAVLIPHPEFIARNEARLRAQAKLTALGLTADEIAAL